jgi:HD-GYP domain-containing protein (c-di-GMP phosphodiesterase class II)
MTGIFLSTFNENNNIVKYYVEFLVFANELFENQNVYFRNHTRKVTAVSLEIGKALFLDIEELKYLKLGASLHDIGMIADIGNLIDKNSDLNKDDVSLIKMHPLVGSILLEPVSNIYPISPIIKYHHEKIDGNGYPFGIVGSEIPQIAQIVGLAEFFVGLISDRSYKKGMSVDKARDLIEQSGKKMYDQTVIDAFLDSIESIEQKFLKIDLEAKRIHDRS